MKFFIFIFLCLLDVSVWARTSLTMGVPFRIRRIPAILEYQNFVSEVLKDAGFDVVVKDTPAKMPYDLLVQGEVDAITYDDKTLTYERKKAVTVSFPLIRAHVRIFYRKDNTKFDPKSLKAFKGCISMNNVAIQNEASRQHLKFISTSNPLQSVQMVADGKADYFLSVEEVGLSSISVIPETQDKIAMADKIFMNLDIFVSFRSAFKNDLPRIEAAFRKHMAVDISKEYPILSKSINKNL